VPRTAKEVMESHLNLRQQGELERDLTENYHPDVIFLTASQVYRGHDGVRESAHKLWRVVGDAHEYSYESVLVEDRIALLEWLATTDKLRVTCGVDSYLIEDGLICGQTIHYRVESLEYSVAASTLSAKGELGPNSVADSTRMGHLVTKPGP
jgi:hypothetical protein